MPLSMTAFARCDNDTPWGVLSWELRSVNHRYLEMAPRLPEELRRLEPKVREIVGKRLGRGKIDLNLRFNAQERPSADFELDDTLLNKLVDAAGQICQKSADIAPLSASDLLRWPGVVLTPDVDIDALQRGALELLAEALQELVETREREGRQLQQVIDSRLADMGTIITEVKKVLPEMVDNFRLRLSNRLQEVRQELDSDRLEQEIALFAQKIDVDEELDRLQAHLQEVGRVLQKKGPIGRRLDFLMQELNREANTLGSKAADIRLTNASVDLKVLIEQMREQIQNIE